MFSDLSTQNVNKAIIFVIRIYPSEQFVTYRDMRSVTLEECLRQQYSDVIYIMGAMVSQITSLIIVYSTVYSGVDQRPVNSTHKWSVTRKMFPFGDVTMNKVCILELYTLRSRQNGRHVANDVIKCVFLNENCCISIHISLKFVTTGPIDDKSASVPKVMA